MARAPEEGRARTLLAAAALGVVAAAALAALLMLGLARSDTGADLVAPRSAAHPAPRHAAPTPREVGHGRLFAPTSFWNQHLAATAALDPNSAALVQGLVAEVQR